MLTYANDSLTYWLPDRIKNNQLALESFFVTGVCQVLLKIMGKKYTSQSLMQHPFFHVPLYKKMKIKFISNTL